MTDLTLSRYWTSLTKTRGEPMTQLYIKGKPLLTRWQRTKQWVLPVRVTMYTATIVHGQPQYVEHVYSLWAGILTHVTDHTRDQPFPS